MTVTTPAAHGMKNGDLVKLEDGAVSFSCQYGVGSVHTWAGGTVTNAITITVGPVQTQHDVTNATYDPATGDMVITMGAGNIWRYCDFYVNHLKTINDGVKGD